MTLLFETLIKLFSHYIQSSSTLNTLKKMLKELEKTQTAVAELDKLLAQEKHFDGHRYLKHSSNQYMSNTIRIYSAEEHDKLSIECLGLLHDLEKTGIVSPKERDLLLLHITLGDEETRLELDHFKRMLRAFFNDKFTSIEHWWLQQWPFKELENIKGH